jgi:hypothetical protein
MVPAPSTAHAVRVARLIVLWSRPKHLGIDEAERWTRAEVRALLGREGIGSAELKRLRRASPRHGCDWDWLLELEITAPVQDYVDRGPCAEWLGDMRLLGMRPTVMLSGDGIDLEGEAG